MLFLYLFVRPIITGSRVFATSLLCCILRSAVPGFFMTTNVHQQACALTAISYSVPEAGVPVLSTPSFKDVSVRSIVYSAYLVEARAPVCSFRSGFCFSGPLSDKRVCRESSRTWLFSVFNGGRRASVVLKAYRTCYHRRLTGFRKASAILWTVLPALSTLMLPLCRSRRRMFYPRA